MAARKEPPPRVKALLWYCRLLSRERDALLGVSAWPPKVSSEEEIAEALDLDLEGERVYSDALLLLKVGARSKAAQRAWKEAMTDWDHLRGTEGS